MVSMPKGIIERLWTVIITFLICVCNTCKRTRISVIIVRYFLRKKYLVFLNQVLPSLLSQYQKIILPISNVTYFWHDVTSTRKKSDFQTGSNERQSSIAELTGGKILGAHCTDFPRSVVMVSNYSVFI